MRLLFDENLSPLLPKLLDDLFPASCHVRDIGLKSAQDDSIWEFASKNLFTIVTKDDDFRELAIVRDPPPKVIWLTVGNCSTRLVTSLLRENLELLLWFDRDEYRSLLTLDLT